MPQLLSKCGHVDTVKQLRWTLPRIALLHKTWAVTTATGLGANAGSEKSRLWLCDKYVNFLISWHIGGAITITTYLRASFRRR